MQGQVCLHCHLAHKCSSPLSPPFPRYTIPPPLPQLRFNGMADKAKVLKSCAFSDSVIQTMLKIGPRPINPSQPRFTNSPGRPIFIGTSIAVCIPWCVPSPGFRPFSLAWNRVLPCFSKGPSIGSICPITAHSSLPLSSENLFASSGSLCSPLLSSCVALQS